MAVAVAATTLRNDAGTQRWLKAHGTAATATITAVNSPGGERCPSYDVAFTTADGKESRVRDLLSGEPDMRDGDSVEVLYDPAHPGRVRPAGLGCGTSETGAQLVIIAALFAGGIGCVAFVALGIRRWLGADERASPGHG